MRAMVVLPSYNERQNIAELTDALLALDPQYLVCIVDDSSPDGTSDHVTTAIASRPHWSDRVHLITRRIKDGRGGAVRDGLAWAVLSGEAFDAFVEMDCDFSHEPADVPRGLALLGNGWDVVIGARYPDGTIIGWPLRRRIFSAMANLMARVLVDRSVPDYTNGFRFYSPAAVQVLLAHPQRHRGYIYLSESLAHLLRAGMRVRSFPIRFVNRERGSSNTDAREILAALVGIVAIALEHHRGPR